ncbi:lysozyme inhibitor LprI family protein [Hyphomicrobium sp.]|uniref:lysozyme inhibitor LprI family protein n=1 Tax=Hyphomicrobium sp. TaxID=82 RepID=UPI002E357271|nr:lysozyme inhibitor LprI family protein [Hyphomicrobium sp.]HEX2843245.1 lysozyme inhibitor LprI family protein [Hyphomicrobium sp.]
MRILRFLLPLAACLSLSASALADDPIDCTDPSTTYEMNFCSDKSFNEADAKLNATYKKVLAHIAASDLEPPYDPASWEKAMRESQRAWVAFRDADCKGAVPMEWSGGTGTGSAVAGCMTEKTNARIKELEERYGEK